MPGLRPPRNRRTPCRRPAPQLPTTCRPKKRTCGASERTALTGSMIPPEAPSEPVVWIVDSQEWLRACLRAELIDEGFDPVGYQDVRDALLAIRQPAGAKPDVMVVELCGQTVSRPILAMLAKAGVPTILLGGAAELSDRALSEFAWAAVLRRPFTVAALADALRRLVPAHPLRVEE